jgi:hypothetical protein
MRTTFRWNTWTGWIHTAEASNLYLFGKRRWPPRILAIWKITFATWTLQELTCKSSPFRASFRISQVKTKL